MTLENGVCEHRRVSTTKDTASIMMLGVVASNGRKILPVWFELGCRLTSAVYKEVLETQALPLSKKFSKKLDYVFQQDGAPIHTAKTVHNWLDANMSFYPKNFWLLQSPALNPLDFRLVGTR